MFIFIIKPSSPAATPSLLLPPAPPSFPLCWLSCFYLLSSHPLSPPPPVSLVGFTSSLIHSPFPKPPPPVCPPPLVVLHPVLLRSPLPSILHPPPPPLLISHQTSPRGVGADQLTTWRQTRRLYWHQLDSALINGNDTAVARPMRPPAGTVTLKETLGVNVHMS